MSTSYTPTSNWTNRDLKGRDLDTRPLRPAEPVSFNSDPATERLSRRMTEDVRPVRDKPVVSDAADDDFMDRPMVNASSDRAVIDGPDIFDAPMVNTLSPTASTEGSVFDTPMMDHRPERAPDDEAVVAAAAPSALSLHTSPHVHDEVITPSYGAAPVRRGLSPVLMVGAPLAVVAVAAVGWMALSGGEPTPPTAEPTQPQEIAAATPIPAADPLINMPVSETGAPVEVAAAATPTRSPPQARPARAEPVRTQPARAEPAPAESAPPAAIVASEPATPAVSPEPAPAQEPAVEPPPPLIATEPLPPQ